MSKVLPILGIAAACLVAVLVIIGSGLALYLLPPLLALTTGVFMILRRDTPGLVGGVVLILLAIVAAVLVAGNITFKGGDSVGSDDLEPTDGWAWGAVAGVLVALALVYVCWGELRGTQPLWAAIVGIAAGVGAVVVLLLASDGIGEYDQPLNYLAAALAIASALPAFLLARGPEPQTA